jgi:hypothetical protein
MILQFGALFKELRDQVRDAGIDGQARFSPIYSVAREEADLPV